LEVGNQTIVDFQIRMEIAMPPNAVITLDFPLHNPEAPRSLRRSYFVDPANTVCLSVKGADAGLTC